jgi:hypothetical protein
MKAKISRPKLFKGKFKIYILLFFANNYFFRPKIANSVMAIKTNRKGCGLFVRLNEIKFVFLLFSCGSDKT